MIDRIVFRIEDYNLEELKKHLSLDQPISVNQETREVNKGAYLRNLKLTVLSGGNLSLKGSLHKYAKKGYNYESFTPKEAQDAIKELHERLNIPLNKFIITNMEISINMQMSEDPMKYINMIRYYKKYRFSPMKPLTKTSKIKGCYCKLSEYEIKFYDKTFESTHRKNRSEKEKVPKNILRYEIALSAKQFFMIGFKGSMPLTAQQLLNPRFYSRFIRIFKKIFADIQFHDITLDYAELSPKEVKKYIFAISEDYGFYLDYLKENIGEKEYRKEIRATNSFLRKIEPLKKNKYEKELKDKFEEMMSFMYSER